MVQVKKIDYKWYESLAMNILKNGPIPKHIAFIMDGNRRFAKRSSISILGGHTEGAFKLLKSLRWCIDMGIKECTVFAFSIHNFNRSEDEIRGSMELFIKMFGSLIIGDHVKEEEVRIRVMGDITLLPIELQEILAKLVLRTEKNNKLIFNLALPYSSTEEITMAVQAILKDYGENLQADDINEELIRQCFYTRDSDEPDLFIRTAGNTRISDFLMWQISSTILYFSQTLWPALSISDFLLGILHYQRSIMIDRMSNFRNDQLKQQQKLKENFPERVNNFLRNLDSSRRDIFIKLANANEK